MNIEQAMIEAVTGHNVTHDGLGPDTFVSYDFNGFEQRTFKKHFGEWASCSFIPQDADNAAEWRIELRDICGQCHGFIRWEWGTPICGCIRQAVALANLMPPVTPVVDAKTLKPISAIAERPRLVLAVHTPSTGLDGFLAAQAATEPKRDVWGRPID